MIGYGVRYKEYLEIKLQQAVADAEHRVIREREIVLEAERAERRGREILDRIAHELRTPLTAAKSSLEMVSRYLIQGRIEPASRFVVTAREAVDRLSRLS